MIYRRAQNYIEHALRVDKGLIGLTLEQLGLEPRMEDLIETFERIG